ncbi:MAG: prepilin-type N-terminal cleavage/methylation domain-containing protein [Planctomycetota bacterium]|jgi:prepilin-type N-terminal cleavage/methylation domain-containing protein
MHPRPKHAPAFTLIEVIIVVAIVAILAAMAVPRLLNQNRRQMQEAADGVADLLIMFAQREALSDRPAGIWHDADRNWIVLMTLDRIEDDDEPATWQQDHAVKPVKLPPIVPVDGVQAFSNGEPIDISQWPIVTQPGRPRPDVEITLSTVAGLLRTIVLPAHAISPYQSETGYELVDLRSPIDLDAEGRHREDW